MNQSKYYKYKNKYLSLKNQMGGGGYIIRYSEMLYRVRSAIDMACRFNNNVIVNHVIYKIKTHLPEIYEKLPEKLKNIKINSNDI